MQMKMLCIVAILTLSIAQNVAWARATTKTPSYYTAAVFEYVQTQNCTYDPKEAQKIMKFNVDMYTTVAKLAKSKEADILVFPEYGLFPECIRNQSILFCEKIPDPAEEVIPCIEAKKFSKSPTLRSLSCMARNNSMVIQANMAEILHCAGEPGCPPVGFLRFNVNVVFDRDGTLITRYRKEHLWNEFSMDMPRKKQNPKFTVDFGTFLSYVCYDVFLGRIVEEIKEDIDGVVFSTYWENTMPFGMTVQFFEAFAIAINTTLLAADIQAPGQWAVGSGIFSGPYGSLAYTFDTDGVNKLVVARVPRRHHVLEEPKSSITAVFFNGTTSDWKANGESIREDGSDIYFHMYSLNHNTDIHYHVLNLENYTLHQLTEPSAFIEECNNGLCCSLNYSTEAITQPFYFAVFNGTQDTFDPYHWNEEDCFLMRCNPALGRECATFPMWSNVNFHYMNMTGNFSTPFVYPSIVKDHYRLIPYDGWNYNREKTAEGYQVSISFDSRKGRPLVVAGMKGRLYRKDPSSSFF